MFHLILCHYSNKLSMENFFKPIILNYKRIVQDGLNFLQTKVMRFLIRDGFKEMIIPHLHFLNITVI